MALLAAVPANVGHGHAANSDFRKHFLYCVKSARLNYSFKFCHHFLVLGISLAIRFSFSTFAKLAWA
jgi:hypothetical protein